MGFFDFIKSILTPTQRVVESTPQRVEVSSGVNCSTPSCERMTVIDSHTLCYPCYKIANPEPAPPTRGRLDRYNRLIEISGVAPGGSEAELRSSLQAFNLDNDALEPLISSPIFRSMMKW